MNRFRVNCYRKMALVLLGMLDMVVISDAVGEKGLSFDYIGQDIKLLKLSCQVTVPSSFGDVVSITIYNASSQARMAWVQTNKQPTLGDQHQSKRNLYIAGGVSREHFKSPALRVLYLHYESFSDQMFGCNATILKENSEIVIMTWNVTVNRTASPPDTPTSTTTTTTSTFTDAPYRIGAVKDREDKPFIDSEGLPMTVLIVMLVIVSILLFLALFLLMHRYRSRCQRRDEDMYRPPAYCLAPDHHAHPLEWGDNSSSLKSKGSARTLNSRGHYSYPAHNMPLPPIPHATPSRRHKTYRRPPSVSSSVRVQYIQPQDAIGQESSEDGEIAALSSGSPNVHYKTSRGRQNSPLYACVPVSSTDE